MEINKIKNLILNEVKSEGIKEFEIYINLGRSLSIESKGGRLIPLRPRKLQVHR